MFIRPINFLRQIWSHLPLNSNDVIEKSKAPPSRERFSDEQLHSIAQDDEPLPPVDSIEEDLTVLALFDTLVNEDVSGQLRSLSTDSTFSSSDNDDDEEHHVSSSEMDDEEFGIMPSSSRIFWQNHPFQFLFSRDDDSDSFSDSIGTSTPSEAALDSHSLYSYLVSSDNGEVESGEGEGGDASQADAQGQDTEPHPFGESRELDFEPNSCTMPTYSSTMSSVQSLAQPSSDDGHALTSPITMASHGNDNGYSSTVSSTTRRQRPVPLASKGQSSSTNQSSQPEASGVVFSSTPESTSRRTESRRQVISSLPGRNYDQYRCEDFLRSRTATGLRTFKNNDK